MNNYFSQYKEWLIIPISLIILLVFGYFSNIYIENVHSKILKNNKYTIGEITEKRTETRSNYYNFKYYLNNKKFKGGLSFNIKGNYSDLKTKSRFFVVYDSLKPKNSVLLPFLPVPDSITSAPPEGWKELPIPVDKEEIRKFLEDY